jgi:hypothetical protein
LAEIAFQRVSNVQRSGLGITDGQPADLRGCGDVTFEQRRRYTEDVGDIVEAVAGIVGR